VNDYQIWRRRRWWMPAILFLVGAVTAVAIWKAHTTRHQGEILSLTETAAVNVAVRLEQYVGTRVELLEEIRYDFLAGYMTSPEIFEKHSLAMQDRLSGFQAINWIDPEGTIRWVVPHEPNLPAEGQDLYSNPVAGPVLREAAASGKMRMTPPLDLYQGGRGFATYQPIAQDDGTAAGFINGVFRIQPLLADYLPDIAGTDYSYRLRDGGSDLLASSQDFTLRNPESVVSREIQMLNRTWLLEMQPEIALIRRIHGRWDEAIMALALLLSAVLAGAVHLAISREAIVKATEKRYRDLVETSNEFIFQLDADGSFTFVNSAAQEIFGYPPKEMTGNSLLDFAPRAERESIAEEILAPALAGETIRRRHATLLHCSGQEVPLTLNLAPTSTSGASVALTGIAIDETLRHQTERALKRSEARFRALTENTLTLTIILNAEGQITYVSPAIYDLFGTKPPEIIEQPVSRFVLRDDREAFEDILDLCRRGDHASLRLSNVRSRHMDGHTIHLAAEFTNMLELDGVNGIVVHCRDISLRIEAEAEKSALEESVRNAQKLESLGVLAGGIAHDFNNLLVGILGGADLAHLELPKEHPLQDVIEGIRSSASHAADLTRQMLAYSGRAEVSVHEVDLNSLVSEMTPLVEASISKRAQLQFDLQSDLPKISADAVQLRQIIMNMIINASDAIGDRDGTISVRTGRDLFEEGWIEPLLLGDLPTPGPYVFVEVEDTGCGMDDETKSRVFDPFFTTKFHGRGLGLASVLGIVRSHHGTIRLESELGRGTRIRVFFPAGDTAQPIESPAQTEGLSLNLQGKTVLVVDDEQVVRSFTSTLLTRFGCTVHTAEDGLSALAALSQPRRRFDLVIMDVTMPRMGGVEALQELRRNHPDLPVLLCSGYDEQDSRSRFAVDSQVGFLHKPFTIEQMTERIREVLTDV